MTDSVFFDTDCICAFLWVNEESLLEKMYHGKIIIPQEVYDEIDRPEIPHLKERVNQLISKGAAEVKNMDITSEEYSLYRELTTFTGDNKVIGKGEAASISLAKTNNGILGSNNLRDIKQYIDKYALTHITTGDILVEAFKRDYYRRRGECYMERYVKKEKKNRSKFIYRIPFN